MAKRKAKESLEDLLTLAQSKSLIDGFLDDELWDCCQDDARERHKYICDAVLLEQLEFLADHGYHLTRIRELIEQADMAS